MISIQNLQQESSDTKTLENYLSNDFDKIYDFFEFQKHSKLVGLQQDIQRYISLNWTVLKEMDKHESTNLSFMSLLLDVCERLGLRTQFELVYGYLSDSHFNIGSRLNASVLYLIDVNSIDDYLGRYDDIYNLLQTSYETEEDKQDRVLTTIINYYSQVLIDFGQYNIDSVKKLRSKISCSKNKNEFSFLNHSLIENILNVDLFNYDFAYRNIHSLLDSFLGRDIFRPQYIPNYIIEKGTDYSQILEMCTLNFNSIREISVLEYAKIKHDSIFHSLQRGVNVLTDEKQLFAYMYSFGNMHYEKLKTAFEFLPDSFFDEEINIVDWGCGQAMATMTYFDFLKNRNIKQMCNHVTLIEPSEIALKRGSLHISRFSKNISVNTINRDLDSIVGADFLFDNKNVTLHLFSNILDIDLFSLNNLLQRIEMQFTGTNYFICVSPYVNDIKSFRLDVFMKHFSKNAGFATIKSIDNKKGEWTGTWTRVVRVFKTEIK